MDISLFGKKINLEIIILIAVIYLIIMVHMCCGKNNFYSMMEGFSGVNTNVQPYMPGPYSLTKNMPMNTNNWLQPNLTVVPGKPLSRGVQNILNRPSQPIPLPNGELDMFATTEFKPECCPNTYSQSTGCACMTTGQYNYLVTRGGNNAPYSEY